MTTFFTCDYFHNFVLIAFHLDLRSFFLFFFVGKENKKVLLAVTSISCNLKRVSIDRNVTQGIHLGKMASFKYDIAAYEFPVHLTALFSTVRWVNELKTTHNPSNHSAKSQINWISWCNYLYLWPISRPISTNRGVAMHLEPFQQSQTTLTCFFKTYFLISYLLTYSSIHCRFSRHLTKGVEFCRMFFKLITHWWLLNFWMIKCDHKIDVLFHLKHF